MKRALLIGAALIAMIAGPAFAADMPVKAPPPPVVVSDWTGWYVGFQVGGERSNASWDPTCFDAGGPPLGTCGSALSKAAFPGSDGSASFHASGMRYGLYSGWMFQVNNWVFGAESDYAIHHQTATFPGIVGCVSVACNGGAANGFVPPFTGDSTSLKFGDDFSFRARAGFLVLPQLQIYGTGGVAAQKVSATVVCNGNTGAACTIGVLTSSSSTTLVGWTVGAGIEWKLIDHILLRGEYRYNDYGTWKQNAFLGSGQFEEFANVHVKSQMATFGIAYLFPPPRW
jgi:outer membrane immunogenic protein